jgi:predicted nucleic acid-binding protein
LISFLDTNIAVAASLESHMHYARSLPVLLRATKTDTFCSVHTIAELYAVLTSLPKPYRQSPEVAHLFLEALEKRVSFVTLSPAEYLEAARGLSSARRPGAQIDDALLLACARKVKADRIYTWNLNHFQAIAPDLTKRIVEPAILSAS